MSLIRPHLVDMVQELSKIYRPCAYLLALLEFDDNEDVNAVRELMDYGLWL